MVVQSQTSGLQFDQIPRRAASLEEKEEPGAAMKNSKIMVVVKLMSSFLLSENWCCIPNQHDRQD